MALGSFADYLLMSNQKGSQNVNSAASELAHALPAVESRAYDRTDHVDADRSAYVEALLDFLGAASHSMAVSLDHTAARRVLGDSRLPEPVVGDMVTVAVTKLQSMAASCSIRLDRLSLSTREAIALVRPTAPLGLVRQEPDGVLHWTLVSDHRGRRVKVYSSSLGQEPKWLSINRLHQLVGASKDERREWLALQPLLPCQAEHDDHGHGPSPVARYLQLLAPERSDIAVIIVFAIVVGLLALSTPIAVEALVNTVAFGQFMQPVVVLAIMLFVFLAFAAAMRAVQAYVAEIIQRRIFVRVSSDLAQRLPRVERGFWNRHYGPELINRFFEVVTVQKVTASLLLDGLALALQTLVGMTVIAFYHPVLLGFDAFLLLLILGIVFVLGRGAVRTSIEESHKKYATAAWLEELARHPVAFRSHGGMAFALEHADRCVTDYLRARATHFRILMRQIIATLGLQALASTVLLGLGGWLVISGELTLGQLVAAELIVTVIVGSFAKIGKYLEGYYDVMAATDKLGHLFDMPIEDQSGVDLPWQDAGVSVTLDGVCTEPAIVGGETVKQASLQVSPGEQVVLCRGSVGLRSDLLEVIGGIREPSYGHVELDGYDVRRLRPASVYSQTAFVRDVEVFAGTIAENIHVGRGGVSEEDMRLALAATGLLEDVLDLPQGLATHIDTEGRMLSRDQLTRLMLARAVAARPRLLLIDGVFDGLPDERLKPVLRGMAEAAPNCTWIVSTGRRGVAAFFGRRLRLSPDGALEELSGKDFDRPISVPRRSRRAGR